MLYFISNYEDPYINLSLEEYLFSSDKFNDDIIIIWRNQKSIFLGKNQNPYTEVSNKLIKLREVPLLRRISGGGTVYHDLGNINMTFIRKNIKLDEINFIENTKFMKEMLVSFGLNVEYTDRKDLILDGKKISGSAQCIKGNKCLYHATLLYNANLNNLNKYLNSNKIVETNATKSVRSKVTNLNEYLSLSTEEFIQKIKEYLVLKVEDIKEINLEEVDLNSIINNKNKIYTKNEWIFEKTPKFIINTQVKENLTINIVINRWRIKEFKIINNDKNEQIILDKLENELFFEDTIIKIVDNYYQEYKQIISNIF